jgi:hypothetical protein
MYLSSFFLPMNDFLIIPNCNDLSKLNSHILKGIDQGDSEGIGKYS